MVEQLGTLIQRLQPSLESLDVRTATVQTQGQRRHLFTAIRFSHLSIKEIEATYSKLEQKWGKIEKTNIAISCRASHLREWKGIVADLQEGRLKVQDEYVNVTKHDVLENSFSVLEYPSYVQKTDWSEAEALSNSGGGINIEDYTSEAKVLGFPDIKSLLSAWLETSPNLGFSHDILVVVPVYAKIVRHDLDPAGRFEAAVRFHQSLTNLIFSVSMLANMGGIVMELHKIPISKEKAIPLDKNFGEFTLSFELSNPQPWALLDLRVTHSDPTGLDLHHTYDQISRYLDARQPAKNPLVWTFDRFCKLDGLASQLKDPALTRTRSKMPPEEILERAVAWLMSLSGLSVTRLEEYEKLKPTDQLTELDSVDILAWDDEKKILFLIGCTIGLPKIEEDGEMIKETARKLRDELFQGANLRIVPIVFSSYRDLSSVREKAKGSGVGIADSTFAENMLDRIKRGRQTEAVQLLQDLTI